VQKRPPPHLATSFHFRPSARCRDWHFASFAAMHHLGRDWVYSGERSVRALNCQAVFDPKLSADEPKCRSSASPSAATPNPIRARSPLSFDSAWGCSQTPVEMHAIIGCPALTNSAVASRGRSCDFDLSDRCGGIVAAEARRRRLNRGHYSHGGAHSPEKAQQRQTA
jgi:hypothetical protein